MPTYYRYEVKGSHLYRSKPRHGPPPYRQGTSKEYMAHLERKAFAVGVNPQTIERVRGYDPGTRRFVLKREMKVAEKRAAGFRSHFHPVGCQCPFHGGHKSVPPAMRGIGRRQGTTKYGVPISGF